MPFSCVVPDCDDMSSTRHRLPNPNKSLVRYYNWLNAIGNVHLKTLDRLKVYKNYRICHRHFEAEYLSTNMYLKPDATPTLFLPARNTSQKSPESLEILQEGILEKPLSSINKERTLHTTPSTSKAVFDVSESRSSEVFLGEMPSAYCSVSTCWGSKSSMHRFPDPKTNKPLFLEWVRICANKRLHEEHMTPEKIYNNCRVCRQHFDDTDFGPNNRLKRGVLPHLSIPETETLVIPDEQGVDVDIPVVSPTVPVASPTVPVVSPTVPVVSSTVPVEKVNAEEEKLSKGQSLCRTCFKLVYRRLLNNVTEQSYLNRTISEIIAPFILDKVITFDKADLICPECLVVLSAFAKFITKFLEVEDKFNSWKKNEQLNKISATDEEKTVKHKSTPHITPAEMPTNNQEEQAKSNQQNSEMSQLNTQSIRAYSVILDKIHSNKRQSGAQTDSVVTEKGEQDMYSEQEYCKDKEQIRNIVIQNYFSEVEDSALTNENIIKETLVEKECESCGSCVKDFTSGTENNMKCTNCLTEAETQLQDNFIDVSDSDSISSNPNEFEGDSGVSSTANISNLKGVITFEPYSLDINEICGKGIHNHIIRVPDVKEVDREFIKVLLKNDVKVLNQSSKHTTKNKRILLVGESLLRNDCSMCEESFPSSKLWLKHMRMLHDDQRWHLPPDIVDCNWTKFVHAAPPTRADRKISICPACSKKFTTLTKMESHISREHKDFAYFKCEHCQKSFKHKPTFKCHLRKFEENQTCDVRKCGLCMKWIPRSKFSEHSKAHTNFICEICGRSFANRHHLKLHMEKHDREHNKKPYMNKLCPFCGKTVYNLACHIRTNHEDKDKRKFMCHLCPKVLATASILKKHIQNVHCEKKLIQCSLCKKKCSTSAALRSHHRLKHLNVSKHTCVVCGERFLRGDYYRRHMNRHARGQTGRGGGRQGIFKKKEGPVKCKICSKMISSVANLKYHLEIHLAYRDRFKCKYCDVSFNLASNMRRHERQHKDFKHRCNICWKRFTNKEDLDEHIITHEKRMKYRCHVCMQRFARKYLLSHHVMVEHRKNIADEEKLKEKETVFKEALEEFLVD